MQKNNSSNWLINLRWFAFIGQVFVLFLSVFVFKLSIPWKSISLVLILIPVSNLIFKKFESKINYKIITGSLIVLDIFLLTAVLAFAGGPSNPFTIFYFLGVVLAALLLDSTWTWATAAISSLGFGILFIFSIPVPEWSHHGENMGLSLHLHGMLAAYLSAAFISAYFLNKIALELKTRERKLERLENIAANQKKLAALTTITANAAHELNTPLSTIAVICHELNKSIHKVTDNKAFIEDINLLTEETARCKNIIINLSEKTGDLLGETPANVSLSDLLNEIVLTFSDNAVINLNTIDQVIKNIPKRALTQAIKAVTKNAIEASEINPAKIEITCSKQRDTIEIKISDNGKGMSQEILERIGEPFYSTKPANNGMGLGIYITKLTLQQLGGHITFDSKINFGTTVTITLPIERSDIENYEKSA